VAQHQHQIVPRRAAQRLQVGEQPLQQGAAFQLQQAFGDPAHAPAGTGGEDDETRLHGETKQVGAEASAADSVFFAFATSMSRGSGTPFFTASTSAITLTAISAGVLLPM